MYWGVGFVVIAVAGLILSPDARSAFLTIAICLWGLRLASHFWRRSELRGHTEDVRYQGFRKRHEETFALWSLVNIFLLQGALVWLISLPIQFAQANANPPALSVLDVIGLGVFLVGFAIELHADRQLARFKKDPSNEGRFLSKGIWAWSRHPNYFGEALLWWGLYLVAASDPIARWAIFSPILVTFLLLRVSGVPLMDAHLLNTKSGYGDYMARTSPFIPWPPRR